MYKFSEVPELLENLIPLHLWKHGEKMAFLILFLYFQISYCFIFSMGNQYIFKISMGGENYSIDLVLLIVTFDLNHSGYGDLH